MGQDIIDEKITISIGDNVRYLNQEFEGEIRFELNELFIDSKGGYLPDIHADVVRGNTYDLERILRPLEKKGDINVFIFETYCLEGSNQALTGFTPIMSKRQSKYAQSSPTFDRIFISYQGLVSQTTLIHEMGHFLGLQHPWEMDAYHKSRMGFDLENTSINHMTYNQSVSSFTMQQLMHMRKNVFRFRQYLIDKTILISNRA